MILVAGGTGLLGTRLVPELVRDGERVRVLARGIHPFSQDWPSSVEQTTGDLRSSADCETAVRGCTRVVFAASGFGLTKDGGPRSVDQDGAIRLTRAAAAAGVQHVVLLSMYGAAPDAPIELLRCKHAAEQALKASGMDWTVIRLGVLLEQWLQVMSGPLDANGKVVIFGSGTAPVTFTSLADASAVVRRALVDPALRGRTLEWGSETLTLRDLGERLIARAGHGTIRTTPQAMLGVMSALARPFSPFVSRMAGAARWMDTGGLHFDSALGRAELPDIPVRGLDEILAPVAPRGGGGTLRTGPAGV